MEPILCTENPEGDPPPPTPQKKKKQNSGNSVRLQGTSFIDATEIGCLIVHSQQTILMRKEGDNPVDSDGNNTKKIPRSPSYP